MESWQTAVLLLSLWTVAGVGLSLTRQNWYRLTHGVLVTGDSASLMADEWRLSGEARAVIRQVFLLIVGMVFVGEGVLFSLVSLYSLLF